MVSTESFHRGMVLSSDKEMWVPALLLGFGLLANPAAECDAMTMVLDW